MLRKKSIDKPFLIIVTTLVIFGFIVFISASLGLLARNGVNTSSVILNQFISLLLGLILFYFGLKIDYKLLKKYSFYIFLISIFFTLLVFMPQIGVTVGGATRWLNLGVFTIQPSEFLKLGFVIYLAAFLSSVMPKKIKTFKYGLLPILFLFLMISIIFLFQKDAGILLILFAAMMTMFFIAGAKLKHILILLLIGGLGVLFLLQSRPYIKDRFITYFQPSKADPLAEGYQSRQALIAIGSGGVFGKGFGQSIQKFNYLPEPIGDSIFAVLAEEFGFMGTVTIIFLFLLVSILGLKIASRAPDNFSRLLVVGIVILITVQSFFNISAMVGATPISGMPIIFISKGGTALMLALLEVGIILNISRYQK